jgi:glucosamine-6-phosphate deaminase
MHIIVFPDARAVGESLADEIACGIAAAGQAGRRYVLGCPGGRSPRPTYQALVSQVADLRLDLTRLVIAMMDDYVVPDGTGYTPAPAAAHYSSRRFATEHITGPLSAAAGPGRGILPGHVWFPDPADPAGYDERLLEAGGIDLFILASGASDGHVAFNPPGTPADARTRIVDLPDTTRRDNLATFPEFSDLTEVPRHGVTIGVATIAELSARAVLVVTGADKQQAVSRLAAADGYEPSWPASVVAACRDRAVYADQIAAGAVTSRTAPYLITQRNRPSSAPPRRPGHPGCPTHAPTT